MKIKPNTIITLSNNDEYIILSETIHQGNKYFLAMGLKNKEPIASDVAILKEEIEALETYVVKVSDPYLMETLTKKLKQQ